MQMKRKFLGICLIAFVIILAACKSNTYPRISTSIFPSPTIQSKTTNDNNSAGILATPTLKPTLLNTPITQINTTQMPLDLPEATKGVGEYLYRDVIVTLQVDSTNDVSYSYINLDDLSDNGMENSDLVFYVSIKDEHYASFVFPANYALMYFPAESEVDYSDCEDNLENFHDISADFIWAGSPYCMKTNEGRIAIIKYIENTFFVDEQIKIIYASFDITVFN